MDKEIIIDGVDVAGCYFYYKGECRCEQNCIDNDKGETIEELFYREPEHNKWECEPSKNCYYKQLKRLKQENERRKEEMKQLEDFVKSSGEIDHINHEYTYKLRTCLQEIKAIAMVIDTAECRERRKYARKIINLITKAEEE